MSAGRIAPGHPAFRERRMHNRCLGQVSLQTIGAVCTVGLFAMTLTPAEATTLPSKDARMDLPVGLLEIVRERSLDYARAAARGPRGGAVARGPRGAVARGPQGGVAARGAYGGAAAR